jgi:hypothetical protein
MFEPLRIYALILGILILIGALIYYYSETNVPSAFAPFLTGVIWLFYAVIMVFFFVLLYGALKPLYDKIKAKGG